MSGLHSAESVFAAVAGKNGKTLRKKSWKRRKKGAGNVEATNLAEMIVDRAQQATSRQQSESDEVMKLSRQLIDLHQKSKELAQTNKMLLEQLSALLKGVSSSSRF